MNTRSKMVAAAEQAVQLIVAPLSELYGGIFNQYPSALCEHGMLVHLHSTQNRLGPDVVSHPMSIEFTLNKSGLEVSIWNRHGVITPRPIPVVVSDEPLAENELTAREPDFECPISIFVEYEIAKGAVKRALFKSQLRGEVIDLLINARRLHVLREFDLKATNCCTYQVNAAKQITY